MSDRSVTELPNNHRSRITAACVRFIKALQHKVNRIKSYSDRLDPLTRATWVIALAGVLTFAAAVIQAWIFSGQLAAMRSTDHATQEAASAASIAASAATKQAEAALQALRPYMSYKLSLRQVDDFRQTIAANVIPTAALLDVEFTNHGSMAAKIADVRLSFVVEDSLPPVRVLAELRGDTLPAETLLLQNVSLSLWPEGFLIELNEAQRDALEQGTKSLWVYGNFRFNNYIESDRHKGPYDFFFARRYRFKEEGRKRPGFTYEGVPKDFVSR